MTAVPPRKCPRSRCHAPDIQCAEGYDEVGTCPYWKGSTAVESEGGPDAHSNHDTADPILEDRSLSLAWSGGALGSDDLAIVAAQYRPRLVALVGPQNAGKTTFLALLYLLVRRGVFLKTGRFAGSYSFGGWEKLAHYLTWDGDNEPTFPPHTAANEGRRPGLLHLAFRRSDGLLVNSLWTDAPGEWFRLWAVNGQDPNAEGARWTHRHSDAFLLFADSDALAGEARGEAVERVRLLIERLRNGSQDRPLGLIWTKSDLETAVPEAIRQQIEDDVKRHFPCYKTFTVSVPKDDPGDESVEEFIRILNWVLTPQTRMRQPLIPPVLRTGDPLFAFRGKN